MFANYSYSEPKMEGWLAEKIITKQPTEVPKKITIVWTYNGLEGAAVHNLIEEFEFKPLKELKELFEREYSSNEASEIMVGLSRLPSYATKKLNKGGSAGRSSK